MNNSAVLIYFISGFLMGMLFMVIWRKKILPYVIFILEVWEHSWMHRTRRVRINKIRKEVK